jgi:3-deoxy-D-manno-octulosonate 8-phosphate phosphatase (KDO 8-P phosphatase)
VARRRTAPSNNAPRKQSALRKGALATRLERVRLVALDVDGVLTDGRVTYAGTEPIAELQSFFVQDGIAFAWLREAGVRIVWITGRGCSVTEHRARELGVDALVMHTADKRAELERLQKRWRIAPAETAAMGDDLPDLPLVDRCTVFAAPSDAVAEVRAHADVVTKAGGGRGAVRELAVALLDAKGLWRARVDAALRR